MALSVNKPLFHLKPSGTGFNREAWIEIVVSHENNVIYESGFISSNTHELNREDSKLLLFTSYLLNEEGDTTYTATETHDIINESLPALGFRYHLYDFVVPENITSGIIDVDVSFKFRPFRPMVLESHVPELLANLPVFDITSIHRQIEVLE